MSDTPPPIPLDLHLCYTLYSTSMVINRFYKPLLDKLGLTYPQYLVLCVLSENDGRSIRQIAQTLSLEASTITPLVKRLESAALVTRTRNPKDERQVFVHLTDQGIALKAEANCLPHELFKQSGMTEADMIALNDQLRDFRAVIADDKA